MRNVLSKGIAMAFAAVAFFCSIDASAQSAATTAATSKSKTATTAATTTTSAYREQNVDGGQAVIFQDDDLLAGDGAPLIAATGHPGRAFRANLIRPRTQFLSELLKTVETL